MIFDDFPSALRDDDGDGTGNGFDWCDQSYGQRHEGGGWGTGGYVIGASSGDGPSCTGWVHIMRGDGVGVDRQYRMFEGGDGETCNVIESVHGGLV